MQPHHRQFPRYQGRDGVGVGVCCVLLTVVMEAGYVQSHTKIDAAAKRWITESEGAVKICLVIAFSRIKPEIVICKWPVQQRQGSEGVKPPPSPQLLYLSQEVKISENQTGYGVEVRWRMHHWCLSLRSSSCGNLIRPGRLRWATLPSTMII